MSDNKTYAETQRSSQSTSSPNKRRNRRQRKRAKGAKSNNDGRPPSQTHSKTPTNPHTPLSSASSRRRTSYAARINSSPASTTPTHAVKVRSANGSSPTTPNHSKPPRQSQHGNLTKEELLNVRMYQRDICYVAGLPLTLCNRIILGSKKWFGQFGRIRDISITDNHNCIRTNWMCAHIKYYQEDAATKAVQAMNGKMIDDGRILEANYGTQRYCEHFIHRTKCPKSRCPFRHSWCALTEVMKLHRDPSNSPRKVRRQLHRESNSSPQTPQTPRIQVLNTRSYPVARKSAAKVITPEQSTARSAGSPPTPQTPQTPQCQTQTRPLSERKTKAPQQTRPPQNSQQQRVQHGQQRQQPVPAQPHESDDQQEDQRTVSPASTTSSRTSSSKSSSPSPSPSIQNASPPMVSMEKMVNEEPVVDDRDGSTSAIAQNVEQSPSPGQGIRDNANRAEYNQSQPRTVDSDVAVNYASSDVGSEHVVVVSDEIKLWMEKRIRDMERELGKHQKAVEVYKFKYSAAKEAYAAEKAQVSELTKITRCLIEERKAMCSKYDRISLQYATMQQQHSSTQQQNQSLRQKVANLEKEIQRMAAWSPGTVSPHSGRAGHPSTTRHPTTLLDPYSSAASATMIQRGNQQHPQQSQSRRQQPQQPQQHQHQQHQNHEHHRRAQQAQVQGQMVDYHLWQWHDVYRWLMSIPEGRMARYASALQSSLQRENIDGSTLKTLNSNDLHRIGISDFEDKQIVLQHIVNLQSHLGLDSILDDLNF